MIADNEKQAQNLKSACEDWMATLPRFVLTKQVGMMLHGSEAHGFVCKSSGVCKYNHLALAISKATQSVMAIPEAAAVPLPRLVQSNDATPVAMVQSVHMASMQSQLVHTKAAAKAYRYKMCEYDGNHYHMWHPDDPTWEFNVYKHSAVQYDDMFKAVVYLPSTDEAGTEQPLNPIMFTGSEIVFSPIVYNTTKKPWKQDVPVWVPGWIQFLMTRLGPNAKWSMMGFSRGAAWGLHLSGLISCFWRILLVGSYMLPRWTDDEKEHVTCLWQRTQKDSMMFVYGDQDPWLPNRFLQDVIEKFRSHTFENCGHEMSKQRAMENFWRCLVYQQ